MSSRRSSASSVPPWRSSLPVSRKSSQPPSVSVVFAEREQSSPQSESAAAKLSRRMSLQSLQSRKRDRDNISVLSGVKGDEVPGEEVAVGEQFEDGDMTKESNKKPRTDAAESQRREGHVDSVVSEETGGLPADRRTDESERSQAVPATENGYAPVQSAAQELKSPTHKSSWFSFGHNESKQRRAEALPSEPPVTNTSPTALTELPPQSAAESHTPPSDPIPIKSHGESSSDAAQSRSPGWFGSPSKGRGRRRASKGELKDEDDAILPPQRFPQHASPVSTNEQSSCRSIWFTPQPPTRPQPLHTPSFPSSLEEGTPTRVDPPPIPQSMPELISTQTSEVTLSALNPSTSRFALSIPLLGRPKMPLEKVLLNSGNDKDQVPAAPAGPGAVSEVICTPASVSEPSETPAVGTLPEPESSTWWDFVGLGSRKTTSASLNAPSSPAESVPPAINGSSDVSHPQSSANEVADPEVQPLNSDPASTDRPPSFVSGETVGSTWYSPLGWYDWYTKAADTSATASPVPKTEAEIVKEEALARPDPPIPSSVPEDRPSPPKPASAPEPINPIVSSLLSNSKGWTSFFSSSHSLTIKSITDKDDAVMEVMNIDDDDSVAPSQAATAAEIAKNRNPVEKALSNEASTGSPKPVDTPPGLPLTSSDSIKRKVGNVTVPRRGSSPAPSKKSIPSPAPRPPNLVLPTFNDTFRTPPRSRPPPTGSTTSAIKRTMGYVSNVLFARDEASSGNRKGKGKARSELEEFGKELPRAWEVLGEAPELHTLGSCKKVVVIGVHGWFPGYAVRTVLGEPTGTSAKFANMMNAAVDKFADKHGIEFEQVTNIPLEGEGKIEHRVQKLYGNLTSRADWMEALHSADVIFVATHSQGSIVSTHLISRLIADGHIRTAREVDVASSVAATVGPGGASAAHAGKQRVCCLALCGIHLGPLAYLQKSSLVMPYIQYFESEAAAELFEFQHTESQVSNNYVNAIRHVLDHGVKLVYIASLNDQVVPVYSGAFSCVTHPLILRALYIDGDAYHTSDFLSNLLVLLFRIRNAGLSDGGLLAHLSEATAGSLNGVGHSTVYEELATFTLAVEYLFLANDGIVGSHELVFEPFNARSALNDYEIPWALRDLIADDRVVYLFSKEFADLKDAFDDWQPRTTILRDLKRKLEPIRRLKLASRL